jgi:hypothetical protein
MVSFCTVFHTTFKNWTFLLGTGFLVNRLDLVTGRRIGTETKGLFWGSSLGPDWGDCGAGYTANETFGLFFGALETLKHLDGGWCF